MRNDYNSIFYAFRAIAYIYFCGLLVTKLTGGYFVFRYMLHSISVPCCTLFRYHDTLYFGTCCALFRYMLYSISVPYCTLFRCMLHSYFGTMLHSISVHVALYFGTCCTLFRYMLHSYFGTILHSISVTYCTLFRYMLHSYFDICFTLFRYHDAFVFR